MGKRLGQWLMWIGIGSQLPPALKIHAPLSVLFGDAQAVVGVLISVLGGFLAGLGAVKVRIAPAQAAVPPRHDVAAPAPYPPPVERKPETRPPAPAKRPAVAATAKTRYRVVLVNAGLRKIQVIREVRALTGLSLIEVIDLVDATPTAIIKKNVSAREAGAIKGRLEALGATVELR